MNEANQQDAYEYAGFWVRTGASLIDWLWMSALTALPLVEIYGIQYFVPSPDAPLIRGPADFLLTWVFPAVATLAFWAWRRATPGKMAIHAVIVDARTGGTPTFGQWILRYIGYFVSAIPCCLGCFWVAWDRRKQGWHDKMAGTVVIRPKNRGPLPVSFEGARVANDPPPAQH